MRHALHLSHRLYGRERPPALVDTLLGVPVAIGIDGFIRNSDAGTLLVGGLALFALGAIAIKMMIEKKIGIVKWKMHRKASNKMQQGISRGAERYVLSRMC